MHTLTKRNLRERSSDAENKAHHTSESKPGRAHMNIQNIEISQIKPAEYNPRKDLKPGDAELEKLRAVIDRFDLVEPLVWNRRTGNLVGGHQRLKILKARGDGTVPAVVGRLDGAEGGGLSGAVKPGQREGGPPALS